MCGRYNILPDAEAWITFFSLVNANPAAIDALPSSFNVAPGGDVPVVHLNHEGGREVLPMRWGLVPFWAQEDKIGYKMINARAETVREKPAYRRPFNQTRCLIPTVGFYEWARGAGGQKQPHVIRHAQRAPLVFAGLWDGWAPPGGERLRSCSIITTVANSAMRPIHHRMPVILARDQFAQWLEGSADEAAELMQPCPPDWLDAYPVSTYVNKPQNNDARCLERVDLDTGEVVLQRDLF